MPKISNDIFPENPKIIFMGTPDFAASTLNTLVDKKKNILAVVTQPDRPKGRGRKIIASPVKQLALEHNIEVLQPERISDDSFCDLMKQMAPDILIVVAFGQILRRCLLDIPKFGAINIHASLLPKYRGAAPIQWAVLNNESVTGLTVMRMDEGLDTGPMLFQEELMIGENETAGQLHDRLASLSGDLMVRSLEKMAGKPIEEIPQDSSLSSYASKIGRDISLIDWTMDAEQISAQIRGLDPKPGAYTRLSGKEIKLFSPGIINKDIQTAVPGKVSIKNKEGLFVETGNGLIEIKEVQLQGKKRMVCCDFLCGVSIPGGTVLGD